MAIKLDENLSRHLPAILRTLGHDVHHVEDQGLLGRPDQVVAEAAKREGRIHFTLDVEFADLRKHPPGEHPGIVLFRPIGMEPESTTAMITSFVQNCDLNELRGNIAIVEPGRVRIRQTVSDANQPPGEPNNDA